MFRLIGLMFAALLLAVATPTNALDANPNWPQSLTFGSGPPGGVYYVYGDALAQVLTEKLAIPVNPLPTQGSVHNIKLIESGGAQLGMITMGVGLQGWNGTGDWTGGKPFRNMRALFPMYDAPFQAVTLKRSGITDFAQLDKKRIGGGTFAGAGGTYVPAIMKVLGISAEISYGSFNDMANELLAGSVDTIWSLLGIPLPAVQDVEAKEPITFLCLSPDQTAAIRKAMPEFNPSTIAAGTYRSLDKECATIGVYTFAIGRADLPDDLVYQVVKAVFENQPRLVKATATASETLPQNVAKDTFLPLHPGAVRYYREIGISIPDALAPTN
jgi:uncharacterized protein